MRGLLVELPRVFVRWERTLKRLRVCWNRDAEEVSTFDLRECRVDGAPVAASTAEAENVGP